MKGQTEILKSGEKCRRCDKPAVVQTYDGEYQERHGALPQNHGYYCKECFDEGLKIENETFYG